MYAIAKAGSKQIKVSQGDVVKVDKLNANVGDKIELDVIFKADGDKFITEPSKLTAEVVSFGKEKKIIVFKYKPKKNIRKKQGHRTQYTTIKILSI